MESGKQAWNSKIFLFKSGTAFRISLEKEPNILKQNAVENKHLITEKERTLALYNEEKIREEVL